MMKLKLEYYAIAQKVAPGQKFECHGKVFRYQTKIIGLKYRVEFEQSEKDKFVFLGENSESLGSLSVHVWLGGPDSVKHILTSKTDIIITEKGFIFKIERMMNLIYENNGLFRGSDQTYNDIHAYKDNKNCVKYFEGPKYRTWSHFNRHLFNYGKPAGFGYYLAVIFRQHYIVWNCVLKYKCPQLPRPLRDIIFAQFWEDKFTQIISKKLSIDQRISGV